ncbi:hypothetical protein HK405_001437, partial [Cladochytrium tenue]
ASAASAAAAAAAASTATTASVGVARGANLNGGSTSSSSSSSRRGAAPAPSAAAAAATSSELVLGFDRGVLAEILSPTLGLCDKEFRLQVDAVTFVGQPTLLGADRASGPGRRFARAVQRRRISRTTEASVRKTNPAAAAAASRAGAGTAAATDSPAAPDAALLAPLAGGGYGGGADLRDGDAATAADWGGEAAVVFFSPRSETGDPLANSMHATMAAAAAAVAADEPESRSGTGGHQITMFN